MLFHWESFCTRLLDLEISSVDFVAQFQRLVARLIFTKTLSHLGVQVFHVGR